MPPPLEACLRWRIVWARDLDGMDVPEIVASPLRVSESTVKRVLAYYDEGGDVWPNTSPEYVAPRVIGEEDEWELIRMLVDTPEAMLKEHFRVFCSKTGCLCHISTFCRAVKRLGFTRKKLRAFALKRDQAQHDNFLAHVLTHYRAKQLLFLDETAKDERAERREWGYALRGEEPLSSLGYLASRERTSSIATFDVKGFVSWYISAGTFNRDRFTEAVRTVVIPNMNPYPGKRSVLVLDNASIHHTPELVNMMATAGCLLLFTPPYCFTLTPLDNSAFGGVKSYLQKRPRQGTMQEKMDDAFSNAVSRKQARHYFRKCGYGPIL